MTGVSPRRVARVSTAEWIALALLSVSVSINYLDRGTLSVAADQIRRELHLEPIQEGWLLGAFFWTYASSQMLAGWLIEKYNVVWVYALGYFVWSGATLLTGFAAGITVNAIVKFTIPAFAVLFVLRLLLGVSESVAYPSYSKIIAAGFPERRRGIANAMIDAGCKLGPAVGILAGGWILHAFNWRTMFIVIGGVSMIWLIPWMAIGGRVKTGSEAKLREGRTDVAAYQEILAHREAWGTFLGLFCGNYAWYFMLTWLPQYFTRARHFSEQEMTRFVPLPFFAVAIGALIAGWVADRWIHRGGSPTLVRKTFVVSGLTLWALIFLPAGFVNDTHTALRLMVVAGLFFGMFSANNWAVTQSLAGTMAAGKWTSMQNMCGNFAGIVVPVVTGAILQKTGAFYWAVASVCGVAVIGALSYLLIVRKIEPVTWRRAQRINL